VSAADVGGLNDDDFCILNIPFRTGNE